jgi:signal transduction histidine kinase
VDGDDLVTDPWSARGRTLIEESPEAVVLLDREERVLAASRRARESFPDLEVGQPLPTETGEPAATVEIPGPDGLERLLYFGGVGEPAAYAELRAGFTAAVSHELRTPLARLLVLVESMLLPGADAVALAEQARLEVEQARELIDDVLFLGELESGREIVSLTRTHVAPVLREVEQKLAERAARAGVRLVLDAEADLDVPLRARMLRVVVENLGENAIRYAGPGATFSLGASREGDSVVLRAADDGAGVAEADLARLFERFFRADRARSSRGTGLGLAIVKHIVTAAGGQVEARPAAEGGLLVECRLPR